MFRIFYFWISHQVKKQMLSTKLYIYQYFCDCNCFAFNYLCSTQFYHQQKRRNYINLAWTYSDVLKTYITWLKSTKINLDIFHIIFSFFFSHLLVVNFVLFWQYQIQIKCNDLTAKNVIIFYTYISRINSFFLLKMKLFLVDFCRL